MPIVRMAIALACMTLIGQAVSTAAPLRGQTREFEQPDGQIVQIRVFGDEFYARLEGLDGFTLVRDPETGYFSYAELSPSGDQLVSTGRVYGTAQPPSGVWERFTSFTFGAQPTVPALPGALGIHLSSDAIERVVANSRAALRRDARPRRVGVSRSTPNGAGAPSVHPLLGPAADDNHLRNGPVSGLDRIVEARSPLGADIVVGLTLIVQFRDIAGSLPKGQIEEFLNKRGYNTFGNNGSVRDYFADVSGQKLDYQNIVGEYCTTQHDRSHYVDETIPYGVRALELLQECLQQLSQQAHFDVSKLSVDTNGSLRAVNVFYAGALVNKPQKGLWPHETEIAPIAFSGRTIRAYQISNMGSELTLGTFCHESGHLLFNWPDLYDTTGKSLGTGPYDLMSGAADLDPVPPGAWLRDLAGWEAVTDVTHIPAGTRLQHTANSLTSFVYGNDANPNEAFYVESRLRSGRNTTFPGDGWVIWHVDGAGSNDLPQRTPLQHYMVSLEQADGRFELELNIDDPANDLYYYPGAPLFDATALPKSDWWNGAPSGLTLRFVSPINSQMTVQFGTP